MLLEKEDKIRRSFNISRKTWDKIVELSKERKITKSMIIETALVNLFKELEKEK